MSAMSLRAVIELLRDYDGALLANTLDHIDPTLAHEFYLSTELHWLPPALAYRGSGHHRPA